MKKITMFLCMIGLAAVSIGEIYIIEIEVPEAGTAATWQNTYGQVVYFESGLISGTNGSAINNVVGTLVRTAGSTTVTQTVFASGTTTNLSTGFQINRIVGIQALETVSITNSLAATTVLTLTVVVPK